MYVERKRPIFIWGNGKRYLIKIEELKEKEWFIKVTISQCYYPKGCKRAEIVFVH